MPGFRYSLKKKIVVPAEEKLYSLPDPWPTGSQYLNWGGVTAGLNMLTANSCRL